MESSGAALKKIRLEKGLSLEEAQKQTKVHLNILRAIEEDSLVGMNPVYIRGFLKIYCKFLGVDPNEYSHVPSPKAGPQIAQAPKKAPITLPRLKIKPILITLVFILSAVILFKLGSLAVTGISSKMKAKKPSPVIALKKEKAAPAAVKQKTVTHTAAGIRLVIRAREQCFVSLKSDGQVVFRGNMRKGLSQTWAGKDKMELSLGNAGVVDIEVNGKVISSLGRRGQAIKNILITKEGLSSPR